jgi:hypothetical protein
VPNDVTIVQYRVLTEAAPVQIEGLLSNGLFFYFRSRHRNFRLQVSRTSTTLAAMTPDHELFFHMSGHDYDAHALSSLRPKDAMALIRFMANLHQDCMTYGGIGTHEA